MVLISHHEKYISVFFISWDSYIICACACMHVSACRYFLLCFKVSCSCSSLFFLFSMPAYSLTCQFRDSSLCSNILSLQMTLAQIHPQLKATDAIPLWEQHSMCHLKSLTARRHTSGKHLVLCPAIICCFCPAEGTICMLRKTYAFQIHPASSCFFFKCLS